MQLSPLQSRLAASLAASFFLLVVYIILFSPQFALAAEILSEEHGAGSDAVDAWALAESMEQATAETIDLRSEMYEPDFPLFDRSVIGRAPSGVTSLTNNVKSNQNLDKGSSIKFVFEASSLSSREAEIFELRKRLDDSQDAELSVVEDDQNGTELSELRQRATPTKTLWISANTCMQPERPEANQTAMDPPQLTLYVSTSSDNDSPGPAAPPDNQEVRVFDQGAVMYNMTFSDDVYFTITAPNVSDWFTSSLYNIEVAASVDQSYHSYDTNTEPDLVWVDSDIGASLLRTGNLTNGSDTEVSRTPYTMFAYQQGDVSVRGVEKSYCGLKEYAQIGGSQATTALMSTGLTRRGQGNSTKQEFFITGLNKSSVYEAILVQEPNSGSLSKRDNVAGGGGVVFRQTEFDTKSTGTCMVISNLTFCDQTAYSVPSSSKYSDKVDDLKDFYDSYAQEMYANFEKALAQIQCDAEDTSKYSLARTCDDCRDAYKNWVCSVSIPRCEDFSKTDEFLQMRNIMATNSDGSSPVDQYTKQIYGNAAAYNSSRLARIDEEIAPGPYKEVLPCEDLCYTLVQSCPAALGFGCPTPGMLGFNTSYGRRLTDANGTSNAVTCNFPGSAHYISAAQASVTFSSVILFGAVGVAMLWL
ncbi:stretch-activated Ca2+-permeable channel component-domain-containing protein [Pestalotiopsis sp. NC0098]|nr:stretch-activated Ca2+-permeable channel component-domain-containing protein [Pestalotiopsis sp. NC0098]